MTHKEVFALREMKENKEIIVNVERDMTRVSLLEDGELTELYLERTQKQRVVGNIYLGKVENVLPGMQAAFVNIGFDKNAFLYAADAAAHTEGEDHEELVPPIKDLVKRDETVVVQVEKEPIDTKGARVTTQITLPGRYLVLMPSVNYIGISRRIEEEEERERLKEIGKEICPSDMGLIIRTVAEGKGKEELKQEVDFLVNLWHKIKEKGSMLKAPQLLYKDFTLLYRIIRDLFNEDVYRFVIDDENEYEKVLEILDLLSPQLKDRVELYQKETPIFEFYNIESEINRALQRKVWLKSGGYIIIDSTEALTAIDVNTGKFVGSVDLEDTVLKTNLDAVTEIVRQIRLRNIGGIIIIDFIDMVSEENRDKIIEKLKQELKKDKIKSSVMGFTSLGLLEMTRKKANQRLDQFLMKPCPMCEGRGKVLSEEVVASTAEKRIDQVLQNTKSEAILLELYPKAAAVLIGSGGENLKYLEEKYHKNIFIKGSYSIHPEEITVKAMGSLNEIKEMALPVKVGQVIEVVVEDVHTLDDRNGIARIDGYIVQVDKGAEWLGQKVSVEIIEVNRTYATGKIKIK